MRPIREISGGQVNNYFYRWSCVPIKATSPTSLNNNTPVNTEVLWGGGLWWGFTGYFELSAIRAQLTAIDRSAFKVAPPPASASPAKNMDMPDSKPSMPYPKRVPSSISVPEMLYSVKIPRAIETIPSNTATTPIAESTWPNTSIVPVCFSIDFALYFIGFVLAPLSRS